MGPHHVTYTGKDSVAIQPRLKMLRHHCKFKMHDSAGLKQSPQSSVFWWGGVEIYAHVIPDWGLQIGINFMSKAVEKGSINPTGRVMINRAVSGIAITLRLSEAFKVPRRGTTGTCHYLVPVCSIWKPTFLTQV